MSEIHWVGGDTISFLLRRGEEVLKIPVKLSNQYPGTLGIKTKQDDGGVTITGFELMSNRDSVSLQAGDQILKVDDHEIAKTADLENLSLHAGQKVTLGVRRNDKELNFEYVCAPAPAADFGVTFPKGRFDQSTKRGLPIDRFYVGSCLRAAVLRTGDRLLRIDGSLVLNRRHYYQPLPIRG